MGIRRRPTEQALQNETWIEDITGARAVPLLHQFLQLVDALQPIQLTEGRSDQIIWRWNLTGVYTASSAYHAFFIGQYSIAGARELARTRAPPKAKFFIWFALLDRCWTNQRRQRHGMQNVGPCSFCAQHDETVDHLLLRCTYAREIWFKQLQRSANQRLTPRPDHQLAEWWAASRKSLPKNLRKGFDSLLVLLCWELWKERNRRVFDNASKLPAEMLKRINDEVDLWIRAGYGSLRSLTQRHVI